MKTASLFAALMLYAAAFGAQAASCTAERGKGFADCDRYREAQVIARQRSLFERHGRVLTLHLANGKTRVYRDVRDGDTPHQDALKHYTLARHFPAVGYCLVEAQYYEGGSAFLVDLKSGRETEVKGDALLSPDRRRFVAANFDIEPWYFANFIAVYRIGGKGLTLEYELRLEQERKWGPTGVRWQDAEHIAFLRTSHGANGMITAARSLSAATADDKGARRWTLQDE